MKVIVFLAALVIGGCSCSVSVNSGELLQPGDMVKVGNHKGVIIAGPFVQGRYRVLINGREITVHHRAIKRAKPDLGGE